MFHRWKSNMNKNYNMEKRIQKLLLSATMIFSLTAVVITPGCIKGKKCSNTYAFVHSVAVYPVQSSYNVGDTIWFDMAVADVFEVDVTDRNGKKKKETVKLTDFYFNQVSASVYEIVNGNELGNALSSFTPITAAGSSYDAGDQRLIVEYDYLNSTYVFKLGLVCNAPGVFVYTPWFQDENMGAEGPKKDLNISSDCSREFIERIAFPMNKQADGTYLNNSGILEQYPNVLSHLMNLNKDRNETYTFVVNG